MQAPIYTGAFDLRPISQLFGQRKRRLINELIPEPRGFVTATATNYCACTPGGTSLSCGSSCSGYSSPLEYVKVQTTGTVRALFPYPGISGTFDLTATCILRVR